MLLTWSFPSSEHRRNFSVVVGIVVGVQSELSAILLRLSFALLEVNRSWRLDRHQIFRDDTKDCEGKFVDVWGSATEDFQCLRHF